jgi:hypothetical protein
MTEAEWVACADLTPLYNVVRNRATTRQLRVFMVACCRLKATEFFDPRIHVVLETAECCADDPTAEAIVSTLQNQWATSRHPVRFPQAGTEGELGRVISGVYQLLDDVPNEPTYDEPYSNSQAALARAVFMCLRDLPGQIFTGGAGDAAEYCAWAVIKVGALKYGARSEEVRTAESLAQIAIADILRDIFGNPFRPVSVDTAWLTSTVIALARQMYDSRDFSGMPILADALQDAGCETAAILDHCRGSGPHCRGCWLMDLLLGK